MIHESPCLKDAMRSPLFALLGLILFTIFAGGCRESDTSTPKKRTVLVQIADGAQNQGVSYPAEVRARHETDLAFRVGGKIQSRLVDPGAIVKPGQPLAVLDPADLRLATQAAAAQLSAAESDARTALAERNRHAELLARKFISQTAFELKENALQAARGRLEQARSQHQISTHQGNYGTLSSDFAGVVSAVLAEAGQVVAAGQPVVRIARPEDKEILIAVPESRLGEFRAAREFTVNTWTEPKIVIRGTLRELSPVADPATRTYAARIHLIDPPASLQLGMSARASLAGQQGDAVSVALAAVTDQGQGPFVWTIVAGQVVRTPVEVAGFSGKDALIRKGLKVGDVVVAAGVSRLTEGESVLTETLPSPTEQR